MINYPKGSQINFHTMGELAEFSLSFELPHMDKQLEIKCNARRIVEKQGEIQVGAAIAEPDKEDLKKLKTCLT